MKAKHYKFDLSKFKNCSIKNFVLRELTGEDEENAQNMALSKGKENSGVIEESVRLSLVYVDDKKIEQPYAELDLWNSRTRAFIVNAWKQVNAIENKELDDFLSEGQEVQID